MYCILYGKEGYGDVESGEEGKSSGLLVTLRNKPNG